MGSPEVTGPWQSSSMNSSSCLEVKEAVSRSGSSCLTVMGVEAVTVTVESASELQVLLELVLMVRTKVPEVLELGSALTKAPRKAPLAGVTAAVATEVAEERGEAVVHGCFQTTDCTGIP